MSIIAGATRYIASLFVTSDVLRVTTHGVEVVGTKAFVMNTMIALELLKSTRHYHTVVNNVRVIRQGKRSGVRVNCHRSVFFVGDPTWQSTPPWYASCIAHEAYHNVLYLQSKKRRYLGIARLLDYAGQEAEKKCLQFQLEVLEQLDGTALLRYYVEDTMNAPDYHGDPRSWLSYFRRNW